MKRLWASSKGFTVLELLVVITVIAILATIVIVSYSGIQERARDSERDSHVTQLKIAMEKYFADNSQYPSCGTDGTSYNISCLATPLANYIDEIPHDPRVDPDSIQDYKYVRGGTLGNAYGVKVDYEAKSECKTGIRVVASWWGVGIPLCS